jgi:uncharacterized membrane protein
MIYRFDIFTVMIASRAAMMFRRRPQLELHSMRAVIAAAGLLSLAAHSQTVYEACDIGSLGTDPGFTRAAAINDRGHIAGQSGLRAFLWEPRLGMRDLGVLPGDFESSGFALNDADVVTGWSASIEQPRRTAFVWRESTGIQPLGVDPAAIDSFGAAVNDFGAIVGFADTGAFISDRLRGTRPLGAVEGFLALQPTGINNAGQMVGLALGSTGNAAFVMDLIRGETQLLPLDHVVAINARNRAAGNIRITDREFHAATWDRLNGVRDLGVVSGTDVSDARDINDLGVVVGVGGSFFGGLRHAIIWDVRSGIRDLNPLIVRTADQATLELSEATGINNFGWISAVGRADSNFETHAFVLIPRSPSGLARLPLCPRLASRGVDADQ